jgi:hypothetical protein
MAFDLGGLLNREQEYRKQLNKEPGNCDIRLDLAWCVLLQALHHCTSTESKLQAEALFARALKEVFNVSLISNEARHIAEITRIEFICTLVDESAAVRQANAQTRNVVQRLAADLSKSDSKDHDRTNSGPLSGKFGRPTIKAGRKSKTSASHVEQGL